MRIHATLVRGLMGAVRSPIFQGRFGRIFQGLPSGQDVARAMGVTPLADREILIGKAEDMPDKPLIGILHVPGADPGVFEGNCPLWTYILAEAMHFRVPVQIPVTEPDTLVNTPQLGP